MVCPHLPRPIAISSINQFTSPLFFSTPPVTSFLNPQTKESAPRSSISLVPFSPDLRGRPRGPPWSRMWHLGAMNVGQLLTQGREGQISSYLKTKRLTYCQCQISAQDQKTARSGGIASSMYSWGLANTSPQCPPRSYSHFLAKLVEFS